MSAEGVRERRKYFRVKSAVSLELRYPGAAAPLRAMTSEVSAGGCYIETMFTLEVGTPVTMAFWLGDEKISAKGVIATRYPHVGNGIEITQIAPGDRNKLENYLAHARLT